MIPIKINIDDLEFKDGRYVYSFTADKDMESIDLESSCFGDTLINYLQVEKNPDMTYFVPPEVYEGNLTGIFKDLKELNLEMTDTENSDLWGRIKLNARGMIEEWHSDVTSVEIARTADGIATLLTDQERNFSSLTQKVDGINLKVGDLERETISQISILQGQIASAVSTSDVRSIIQQSYDSISLAVEERLDGNKLKSAINLSTNGVRIKGDLIHLSGRSYIEDGVIRNAHISQLSATKITTGTLNAANVSIINLDVNNLTGNKSQFMQSLWQAVSKQVKIDGTGVYVNRLDGTRSSRLDDNGVQIYNKYGNLAGYFRSNEWQDTGEPALSINAEYGNEIRLGIRPREGGSYIVALSVPKENDRVIIHKDLELNTRNIRVGGRVLRINPGTVGDMNGIFITNNAANGGGIFLSNGGAVAIRQIGGGYTRIN